MKLRIENETGNLEAVVLGHGLERGTPRGINPQMRWHLKNGTFPGDDVVQAEIKELTRIFVAAGVEVHRPSVLADVEQIFTRDIGFVIGDTFVVANMRKEERMTEIEAIQELLKSFDQSKILRVPKGAFIEGGDVIVHNENVFIGIGARTNFEAVAFMRESFPDKNVIGFDLVVDEEDHNNNILHLDCCFQPIGTDEAIIYEQGFVEKPVELLKHFSEEKLIRVSQQEKNAMFPNIFSISPKRIIIEKGFTRLKKELLDRGYEIYDVPYAEVSKLGGLLRCSTLPLRRS